MKQSSAYQDLKTRSEFLKHISTISFGKELSTHIKDNHNNIYVSTMLKKKLTREIELVVVGTSATAPDRLQDISSFKGENT